MLLSEKCFSGILLYSYGYNCTVLHVRMICVHHSVLLSLFANQEEKQSISWCDDVLQCHGRVFVQWCYLRCLARQRASIVLVFYCLQIMVVALIVDWDGLPVWCDVYWFFHGWRHLRKGCWVCVECMICYVPVCICYGSENFGLGSLHDDYVALTHPTILFRSSI